MRPMKLALAGFLLLVGAAGAGAGEGMGQATHMAMAASEVKWGPAPPGLPPGSKAAVLAGDPAVKGSFTLRAWLPDGYKVPPHWHATVENLTVISGKLHVGMGDTFEPAKAKALAAGGFAVMPPEMRHWVWAEGETVLQVHGEGPFAITYVNPADDPRGPAPATMK